MTWPSGVRKILPRPLLDHDRRTRAYIPRLKPLEKEFLFLLWGEEITDEQLGMYGTLLPIPPPPSHPWDWFRQHRLLGNSQIKLNQNVGVA